MSCWKMNLRNCIKSVLKQNKQIELSVPTYSHIFLWLPRLDEHPDFLKRFDVDEILKEKEEIGDLQFLIPLAAAWILEKELRYYQCFKDYCQRWIHDGRKEYGKEQNLHSFSRCLINLWICLDAFEEIFQKDRDFVRNLNEYMYTEYLWLKKRTDRQRQNESGFECLQTVLLGTLYFKDPGAYSSYKFKLLEFLAEQILPDGVHCKNDLIRQKCILEGLMRIAKGVKKADHLFYEELLQIIQKLATSVWSLEYGMRGNPSSDIREDHTSRSTISLFAALRDEGVYYA